MPFPFRNSGISNEQASGDHPKMNEFAFLILHVHLHGWTCGHRGTKLDSQRLSLTWGRNLPHSSHTITKPMFGKIFESLYTGSMVGSGAIVFAVWGYVIANMKPDEEVGAQVELNPLLLTHILGEDIEDVEGAIEFLCAPDALSRTKTEDGKRLVRIGQFAYRVVNGPAYMKIRNEEDRRSYFREKKREQRAKIKAPVNGKPLPGERNYVNHGTTPHEYETQ